MKKSLQLNAYFSLFSAVTTIIFSKQLAKMFGFGNDYAFMIIGFALIYFSCTIFFEIKRLRPLAILWIVLQDFLWVASSIILLIFNPFNISKEGNILILTIAIVVFAMGVNQAKALGRMDSLNNKKSKHFRFERKVNANKQDVWKVISDVANYHKVAPNIDDVKIISGNANGMIRSCSHGKDSWTETCTMWNEEQSYSFEVNTSALNYPYPFKYLKGTWEVQEISTNYTIIVMLFDFQYERKFQNWLLHPLLKGKFRKTAEELLDNWQKQIEGN